VPEGFSYEQHVAFLQLEVTPFFGDFQALVVIVDGDGQLLLGHLLSNNIQVQEFFYFLRFGKFLPDGGSNDVIRDDLVTDINAFVANVYCGSGNELFDVILTLGAE